MTPLENHTAGLAQQPNLPSVVVALRALLCRIGVQKVIHSCSLCACHIQVHCIVEVKLCQRSNSDAGLYCEYQKPYFAKCSKPEAAAVDFTSDPPVECGDVGTQCMGHQDFVLGLGVDGMGNQIRGRCCKEGLRCVFECPPEHNTTHE